MKGLLRETGAAGALVTLTLTLGACNGSIGDHAKPPGTVVISPSPLCTGLDPGPSSSVASTGWSTTTRFATCCRRR